MSQLLPTKVTNPNRHPAHPHSLLHGAHYVAPSIHPMRSLEADCRKYIHKHHSNVDFGSVADDHTGKIYNNYNYDRIGFTSWIIQPNCCHASPMRNDEIVNCSKYWKKMDKQIMPIASANFWAKKRLSPSNKHCSRTLQRSWANDWQTLLNYKLNLDHFKLTLAFFATSNSNRPIFTVVKSSSAWHSPLWKLFKSSSSFFLIFLFDSFVSSSSYSFVFSRQLRSQM